MLEALLLASGSTVLKQDLVQTLWPGESHGDFERGVNNVVSKLRRLLDDDSRAGRIIQTIPKAGYRLQCPLEVIDENPQASESPTLLEQPPVPAIAPPSPAPSRRVWPIASLCLLAVLAAGSALWLRHPAAQPAPSVISVGILPLKVAGDANSLTDETLRGELADAIVQIPNVQVRAAHSLTAEMAQSDAALQKAAQQLSIDLLLVGSLETTANRYELNLELIRGKDAAHIHSFHYAGPRLGLPDAPRQLEAALYSELLHTVPAAISPQSAQGSTQSSDAYNLEFEAAQALNERNAESLRRAIELDRKAIALDPSFAKAYAGLAESELVSADLGAGGSVQALFEQAHTDAQKAIALDAASAQAHSVLGLILYQHDWNFVGGEKELRTAIALNPGLAANHMRLAVLLTDQKNFSAAAAEVSLARQLDPNWPIVYGTAMYVHIMSRQYDSAISDAQTLVAMRPAWGRAHNHLGWAYWYSGKHKEAIDEWRQAAELDHDSARVQLEEKGLKVLDQEGVRAYAELKIAALGRAGASGDYVPSEWFAYAGDRENTLAALAEMVGSHDPESLKIQVNPAYDFLRNDPRYQSLVARIGQSAATSPTKQ